jgi:hypothetical protein
VVNCTRNLYCVRFHLHGMHATLDTAQVNLLKHREASTLLSSSRTSYFEQ